MADSTLNITVKAESKELQSLVDRLNKGEVTVAQFNKEMRAMKQSAVLGSEGLMQLKSVVAQVGAQTATTNAKMMSSYFQLGQQIRSNIVALQSWAAAAAGMMGLKAIIAGSERLVLVLSQLEQSLRGTGVSAKEMMAALRSATGGEVSDLKLAQTALEFRLAGAEIKQIPALMKFAEERADTLGKSFDEVANSLIKLTQGAGERVARELKIPIESVDKAEKEFATSIGVTRDVLNDAGKRRAFYNAILAKTVEQQKMLEGADTAGVDAMDQMDAAVENLKTSFSGLYPIIKVVTTAVLGLSAGVTLVAMAVAYMKGDLALLTEWGNKLKDIGDQIRGLWGANIPQAGLPAGTKETAKPRSFFIDTDKAKKAGYEYALNFQKGFEEFTSSFRGQKKGWKPGKVVEEEEQKWDFGGKLKSDLDIAAKDGQIFTDTLSQGLLQATGNLAQGFTNSFALGQSLLGQFAASMLSTFSQIGAKYLLGKGLSLIPGLGFLSALWPAAQGGDFTPGGSPLKFAAGGGNYGYGGTQNVLVGERGPELMQVGMNGVRVISNQNMGQMNQMGQSGRYGGGMVIQPSVTVHPIESNSGLAVRVEIGNRQNSRRRIT